MIAAVTRCYENFRANSTSRIRVIETSQQKSSQESGDRLASFASCPLSYAMLAVYEDYFSNRVSLLGIHAHKSRLGSLADVHTLGETVDFCAR